MSIPTFIEHQPDPLVDTDDGLQTARNFTIIADSALHARSILSSNGVYRGRIYTSPFAETPDSAVMCTQIVITPTPGSTLDGSNEAVPGMFEAKAVYQRRAGQAMPGEGPVWRVRGSLASTVVDRDTYGNPIRNSSDEPVQLNKLVPTEILHGEWWLTASNLTTLQASLRPYRGAINSTPFFGATGGCMLCHGVEVVEVIGDLVKLAADFEYRPLVTESELNAEIRLRVTGNTLVDASSLPGWAGRYADMGRREMIPTTNGSLPAPRAITEENGEGGQPVRVNEPVMLNGSGRILPTGDPPVMIGVSLYENILDFNTLPGLA